MKSAAFALSLVLLLGTVAARAANEAALLELWNQHMAAKDDHEAAISACRAFAAANANDPLLPVAQGIEAWHHLRAGRDPEALRLLDPQVSAPAGPVADGARRLALGWLTRFDREKVTAALQLYYRKEVAYPKSLNQLAAYPKLPADTRPPMNDRFGKPWVYQLTGFTKLRGLTDQKYSLQSSVLGDLSELKLALAAPYGSHITATPVQVVTAPGNTVAVKFNLPGKGAAVIGAGQAAGDLHLAWVGSQIIVVCDYTHWRIFPRP